MYLQPEVIGVDHVAKLVGAIGNSIVIYDRHALVCKLGEGEITYGLPRLWVGNDITRQGFILGIDVGVHYYDTGPTFGQLDLSRQGRQVGQKLAEIRLALNALGPPPRVGVSIKPTRKLRIFQADSYLSIDLAKRSVEVVSLCDLSSLGVECHPIPFGKANRNVFVSSLPVPNDVNPLLEEIRDFVAAAEAGKKPAVSGRDALRSLKISFEVISNIHRPKV